MSDFYLTLTSNSSVHSTTNSLSKFRNQLPQALDLQGLYWEVRLHTLYCENRFEKTANARIKYMRVCCNVIDPVFNRDQCLAVIPRPTQVKQEIIKPIKYSSKEHDYYSINTKYISDIQIDINFYSADNEKIERSLLTGQPTIVVLHFRKHIMTSPLCVLHIEAKGEDNVNKLNNKSYSFTVDFNNEFQFNQASTVEVALSSIMYRPHFVIRDPEDLVIKMYNFTTHVLEYTCNIPVYTGSSAIQFIDYVNEALGLLKDSPSHPTIIVDKKLLLKNLTIMSDTPVELELPKWIMYNLGERAFKSDRLILSPANPDFNLTSALTHKFQVEVDPQAYLPEMGFLYCNFINYNIIGSDYAPILKAFPLTKSKAGNHYITYTADTLEFYGLSKTDLSSMRFDLRDVKGQYLPFQFPDSNVVMTLIFRTRNNGGNNKN